MRSAKSVAPIFGIERAAGGEDERLAVELAVVGVEPEAAGLSRFDAPDLA